MNFHAVEVGQRGRPRMRNLAIGAAIAIVAVVGIGGTSAYASGSFSQKLTASGCTEGDYSGYSSSTTDFRATATTKYQYPICISGIPGVRAIGGTNASPMGYNFGSVTMLVYKSSSTAGANGDHCVDNNYWRYT